MVTPLAPQLVNDESWIVRLTAALAFTETQDPDMVININVLKVNGCRGGDADPVGSAGNAVNSQISKYLLHPPAALMLIPLPAPARIPPLRNHSR